MSGGHSRSPGPHSKASGRRSIAGDQVMLNRAPLQAILEHGKHPARKPDERDKYAARGLAIAFECSVLDAMKRGGLVTSRFRN